MAKIRVSDSIRYDDSFGSLNVAASIGESEQEAGTATGPNKPWSIAANYSTGPVFVAVGYEGPQFDNDHQWNIAARYKIGAATLLAGGCR